MRRTSRIDNQQTVSVLHRYAIEFALRLQATKLTLDKVEVRSSFKV